MCRRGAILLIWLMAAACPAYAGGWMREKGRIFTATGAVLDFDAKRLRESSFYAEYGALDWLTLGIDYNLVPGTSSHALLFARVPIGRITDPHRFAAQLGVGGHSILGNWWPMYRLSLHYGRSLSLGTRQGWLAIDTTLEMYPAFDLPVYKLDATLGQSNGGRIRPIFQLETGAARGFDPVVTLTPGVMIDGWADGQVWHLGLQNRLSPRYGLSLKLALWQSF